MSPNNDDVVKVQLSAEETAQVESKPVETPKEEPVKEVQEVKETKEVKEVKQETKEVKPKRIKFEDVFTDKKEEQEVSEMTEDERKEYQALKQEKIVRDHQLAFEDELEVYTDEAEREIIQTRLDKLLKKSDSAKTDFFDVLSGVLDPKKVAYIFTAIAEREERESLEKAREKRLSTAVKEAEKKAEVKKTITEIGDLKTIGDKGELSPSEKRRQLLKKGQTGDYQTRQKAADELLREHFENMK